MINIFTRAVRNVVRIPGRSIMLGFVLIVVIVLVTFGVSIQSGTQKGITEARKSLGNEVNLVPNFQAAQQKMLNNSSGASSFSKPQTSYVTESLGKKLVNSKYVKEYDFHLDMTMDADIKPVGNTGGEQTEQIGGKSVQIIGGNGQQTPNFRLIGDSNPAMQTDFNDGVSKLAEGRFYTEDDAVSDPNVAIISSMLAQTNNLKIGSTFTVKSTHSNETAKLKVIGIYDVTEQEDYNSYLPPSFLKANHIYTTYPVAKKINVSGISGIPEDYLSSVNFHIDDPLNLDKFRDDAKTLGISPDEYALDANDTDFQKMVGPMQKLSDFAKAGVISIIIAGAVIMILVMTIITRERKSEVGILRSLGAKRSAVAAQFAAEALIICLGALLLGGTIGSMASNSTANYMLRREVNAQQQDIQASKGSFGGKNVIMLNNGSTRENSDIKTVESLTANVSVNQLGQMVLVGLFMVLCGSLVSTYWIMKYEPMKIMANRN
jgi:putative ABC transport system permease protein